MVEVNGWTGMTDLLTGALTLEELMAFCVRLQPEQAAQEKNSALCVTPLITRLIVDGEVVELKLLDGRWGAGYPRVSDEIQRAAASMETKRKGRKQAARGRMGQVASDEDNGDNDGESGSAEDKTVGRRRLSQPDGFSEEEQLLRQIRHFVRHKHAFKIYTDCGVTGEYPTDDPPLIARLLDAKAKRYRKIYERTLLDETSLLHRTDEEIVSMRAYLANRTASILRGVPDDHSDVPNYDEVTGVTGVSDGQSTQRGRPRRAVYFRQAFTQLWRDIEHGHVHAVAVSDRSRLCRAADLETEFLQLLDKKNTRLIGLIEDLSSLDVSDPLRRGLTYLIASVNEYRLEETAGHSFRGTLQLLESGHPCARIPWWMVRDRNGYARLVPERAELLRRIVAMSLSGMGLTAISRRLYEEGVQVPGITLGTSTLAHALASDALIGIQNFYGLSWSVYPPVIDAATYEELRQVRRERNATLARLQDTQGWAEHLFTGVLFCGVCGGPLCYNALSKKQNQRREENQGDQGDQTHYETGYYQCNAAHKTAFKKSGGDAAPQEHDRENDLSDDGAGSSQNPHPIPHHACLSATKVTAFFDELLVGSPHLVKQALMGGEERVAQNAAQRHLLEEALQAAQAGYATCQQNAHSRAVNMALGMGLREESTGFAATVAGICTSLTETEAAHLAEIEAQMRYLEGQSMQDGRAARALAAVDTVGRWSVLDTVSKNRLLRALFRVSVHPMPRKTIEERRDDSKSHRKKINPQHVREAGKCGFLNIRLAGFAGSSSDANGAEDVTSPPPLAHVWMRRGPGKGIFLPSVAQWIADTFADASAEASAD